MQTATLVHQTSEKVVISQLAEGDVYKRLIPKTAYEVEKIVMGVVTDILHNGETAVVQATEFVRVIEDRQGVKIGCIEELAWRNGWIDDDQLRALAAPLVKSGYGEYLLGLVS